MAFSGPGTEPQPCRPEPPYIASDKPTLEQQEAIVLLNSQDVDDVLAYLKYARSAAGGCQHFAGGHGRGKGLSAEQVEAIKTLSGCADRKLRTWLRDAQTSSDSKTLKSSQGSPPAVFRHTSIHNHAIVLGRPSQSNSSFTASSPPQQSASQAGEPHFYHCTRCKEQRSYKNHSDWRKHEKEHEFTYMCIPDGWVDTTRSGTKCVICGVQDPDEQHESDHNAQACHFSCKRREHMTKHLSKCHGVSDIARGCALAKNWLRSSGRQFWSCGFCACLFTTLQGRLKHIEVEHFRQCQPIDKWNITNVINGLLKQPGLYEAWEAEMTAHHGWEHPEVTWPTFSVEELQYKLEMGPSDEHSVESLAKAAYAASSARGGVHGWNEPYNITKSADREAMDNGHASLTNRYQPLSGHQSFMHPPTFSTKLAEAAYDDIGEDHGEGYGNGKESALCDPIFDDASFYQPADPMIFSEMGGHEYADIVQW